MQTSISAAVRGGTPQKNMRLVTSGGRGGPDILRHEKTEKADVSRVFGLWGPFPGPGTIKKRLSMKSRKGSRAPGADDSKKS